MGCIFSRGSGGECRAANAGKGDEVSTGASTNTANNDPAAITDPRIPLTVRQKFSITKSWKGEYTCSNVTSIVPLADLGYFRSALESLRKMCMVAEHRI